MSWELCVACTNPFDVDALVNAERHMSDDETVSPLDQILFLVRAESRVRIIEHLLESGAATQRELRTELDTSRTTISRSLRSLVEKGWVENDRNSYRLTQTGMIIAGEFSDMLDTVEATEELSDFFRWFPAEEFTPDFQEVNDVEVTASTDGNPYASARKQAKIFQTAEKLRILLPSIDLEATKTLTEQVTQRGLEVETVISPNLEETIKSDEFAPLIRKKMETGRSTVFVSETDLPFYLGLSDSGLVQVGVEDDEGFPRALLETTDESIRDWAEDVYQKYREQAQRQSVDDF